MQKLEYIQLLDCYGKLLTENQQEILKMYYGFDLTLSEIAEQKGVSRQSVSEAITKSKRQLEEFEEKLGFVRTVKELKDSKDKLIRDVLDWTEKETSLDGEEKRKLAQLLNREV